MLAALVWLTYTLKTFDGQSHPAGIATLVRPGGVELAVVRLKSTSPSPGSPVVFLSPGPGIAASILGRVPPYFALFDRLRATGDVILLDARGEGMSKPNLDSCPPGDLPAQPFASRAALLAALAASVKRCGDYWRAQGVDLADYSTDARADDVEALRQALGATRVSLLGFSYGTEVGLNYMRRYPANVDRVVLAATDSGIWDHPNLPSTFDVQLRKLGLYDAVARLLARTPIEVTIDGRPVRVGKEALQLLLVTKLSDSGAAALVNGVAAGETSKLQPAIERFAKGLRGGMTLVGRAIDCNTPVSAARRAEAEAQAKTSLVGEAPFLHLDPRVCDAALGPNRGKKPVPPPLVSYAPVLFISGDLDANAPPFYAEQLRWGLPASQHMIVKNGFHETLPDPEVQNAVVDFLAGR